MRYPIYIISKGRWQWNLTARALDAMRADYRVVVEPQEAPAYADALGWERLLVTPFRDLGEGSIPARNFVWDHAVSEGHARHWILDDNIAKFYRLNRNARTYCKSAGMFAAAEDFVDRYENVGLAGFQYSNFAHDRVEMPPFRLNTRIYSCILINHALPYRWRGRYNEDTDLSLRALKDGWCTMLFNAFLIDKTGTMRLAGGNTDSLYQGDGRTKMAESLRDQHPDCVTVTHKWGRSQHHVDYRRFKRNQLVRRAGMIIPATPNEYGMRLERVKNQPATLVGTPR
jgi:hypothetical protein